MPGICTVISHGSPNSVNHKNAKQLAKILDKQCKPDEPVLLDACNTGKGRNPIAKKLAIIRKTNVTAPDNIIWTTPWNTDYDNPYPPLSNDKNSWKNNIPDLRKPGKWNTFSPKGILIN